MHEVTKDNAIEIAQQVKAGKMPGPAASLAEAMAKVMEQIGYVQKTGTINIGGSYKFAGEAAFIAAIRPELVKQQIVVCPVAMEPLFMEVFQGKSAQNRVVLKVTFRFTHAPSKEFLDVVVCGEGIDSGDKATNKAMTGAMKYALRQAFVIETGNDPDETPSQQQERAGETKAQPAKPEPPKAKTAREHYDPKLDAVKSRDELVPLWKAFDQDVKSGKIGQDDIKHLDARFKQIGQRFPAPAKA